MRIVKNTAALLAFMLAAILVGTVDSSATVDGARAPFAPQGVHAAATGSYIVSHNSGRCVNVQYASTANGAAIIQYDCVNAANNRWFFDGPYEDGYYYIRSENSGRCLNVQAASTANGAAIIQYDCLPTWNNVWYLYDLYGTGYLYIVSANSGRCLNVQGASTANGARLIQYDCVQAANNEWYFA